MIPPKSYQKDPVDLSRIKQNLTPLDILSSRILQGGVNLFKNRKLTNFRIPEDKNPNDEGYVPREFKKQKLPKPVSRVTGHVRYTGEIVRPHLRRNPNN